ncbi:helix-turn-helix transcriptional regulator [Thalassococcus sp. S3]|uniref:helix-turn-helix transcriptional regulator n=1 Tax=Thalassococcus sp. S3 TaxID=2017482 RepID=UPI0010246EE8|nr:LuxR C-terminal-related transcriptional regulator [Thalassococcus sp. S3]QBF30750.1 helix-turn-helix transcriptional regulator [Thalassococcus sp. S3]
MTKRWVILVLLVVQVFCASFFIYDILVTLLGLPVAPINWQIYELIEIGAALGLIFGVIFAAVALRQSLRDTARMQSQLRVASGAFMELLEDSFADWGLTPAERDVALFAIKGLSTQEIAAIRSTSEGTVKAQTNAIYRKAGVTGRPQLLSLFIDDLIEDGLKAAQ